MPMAWWSNLLKTAEPAHLKAGRWGEAQAEKYLRRQGYRILGRRVRVGDKDELDLVAEKARALVFVEVKTRKNEDFGRPLESVNRDKRDHLSRAAIRFLIRLRPAQRPEYFRFDVVEVVGVPGDRNPVIRHIENAFSMEGRYRLPW